MILEKMLSIYIKEMNYWKSVGQGQEHTNEYNVWAAPKKKNVQIEDEIENSDKSSN